MKRLIVEIVLAIAAISIGSPCGFAQARVSNQLTEAMMKVYEKNLQQNPNDYETYYRRATEYYRQNQYMRALSDIDKALKLIPSSAVDMRYDCLMLRANIYENTGRKEQALADIDAALAINPTNYVTLYQKANIEYELGRYESARVSYKRMLSQNPRSTEAMFGLARVAVKERNYGLANEYADNAVNANPSQSDVYVRRASVRTMMGNNTGAVEDLISAISINNSDSRAIRDLVAMGSTDYPATITGLSNAIRQAPRVGMFRYLRAMIAQAHYRYNDALDDFKYIIDQGLYDYPGLYNEMAQCRYALGQYAQASSDVEYAIGATADNADFYITLSQIRRAQWRADEALAAAEQSLAKSGEMPQALLAKALALVDLKRYDEASSAVGEAILNDGENPLYLLNRAWILASFLNQKANAGIYCDRVLELDIEGAPSLKGFASLIKGDQAAARNWAVAITSGNADQDGRLHYLAACIYAQLGDTEAALAAVKASLAAGYANYHDWTRADDAMMSVAPLRDNPKFQALLEQYKTIF